MVLDECLPKRLTRELPGHVARTVPQMGWAGRKNGLLLRSLVEAGVEAFVTMDKNLPFQQNLDGIPFVLVVLLAQSNRYADVAPLLPQILTTLETANRGDLIRLQLPPPPAPPTAE